LATARYDGRIKLWQLDRNAARAADGSKPITNTFCKNYKPVESMAPQSEFRTTDGKRWYHWDAMRDAELDDDAPPWAHIAQRASWFREGNDQTGIRKGV